MIPQVQRWWRGPVFDAAGEQTDEGGDCFAACLASILELPIDGFPNMLRSDYEGSWFDRWQRWLYDEFRCELRYWGGDEQDRPKPRDFAWWIAEVKAAPDRVSHSVVFFKDEFRWDPAPGPFKREWALDEVLSVVALYSITSLLDRPDGPPILAAAA